MPVHLLDLLTGLLKFFQGSLGKKYYGFSWLEGVVILIKYFSFQLFFKRPIIL